MMTGHARIPCRRQAAALLLGLLAAATPARAQPAANRIYALEAGEARVPIPTGDGAADAAWAVLDAADRPVRAWAPADPDGAVRVPPGGWYRLFRRDPAGEVRPAGDRFAAGLVILVTGQSQASGLFHGTWKRVGAHPPAAGDPPAPPVSAVLRACGSEPGCGPEGTHWTTAEGALGTRTLLAELSRRLDGVPLGLADAAWGGASAAQLIDPERPARARLLRVAAAAAPASALLLLAHGTTDAMLGTAPADYVATVGRLVALLRQAGGNPAMPVLQASLAPFRNGIRVLGSGRLADWLGTRTVDRNGLLFRLHLAWLRPLDPGLAARADAIRAAQADAARALGLLPGGDMTEIEATADGVHWSPNGVRQATRAAAAALAAALAPSLVPTPVPGSAPVSAQAPAAAQIPATALAPGPAPP